MCAPLSTPLPLSLPLMRGVVQTQEWGHSTLWVYETRKYVVLSQGEKMGIKPWAREREFSSSLAPYLGNPHHQHLPTHHSYLPGPILIILRLGAGHRHDPSSKSAERSSESTLCQRGRTCPRGCGAPGQSVRGHQPDRDEQLSPFQGHRRH